MLSDSQGIDEPVTLHVSQMFSLSHILSLITISHPLNPFSIRDTHDDVIPFRLPRADWSVQIAIM